MQPLETKKITQPLRTKKSSNLSGREKKSRNLLGKKIMESLGTKKNHAIFWDNTEITKPFLNKINHATSWDKIKHATSWDNKNHATSWDQKNYIIMQPLGTHKTLHNLSQGHFELVTVYHSLVSYASSLNGLFSLKTSYTSKSDFPQGGEGGGVRGVLVFLW